MTVDTTLPRDLARLHAVAHDAAERFGEPADTVFDPCGLILQLAPVRHYYWCTPANVVTFASTGGDGVHDSYFDAAAPHGNAPIVMTMPCSGELNIVVAATFAEFFGLGAFAGWFSLEQLVYRRHDAIPHFQTPDAEADADVTERLACMQKGLSYTPGPRQLERLRRLNRTYLPLLVMPPLPEGVEVDLDVDALWPS